MHPLQVALALLLSLACGRSHFLEETDAAIASDVSDDTHASPLACPPLGFEMEAGLATVPIDVVWVFDFPALRPRDVAPDPEAPVEHVLSVRDMLAALRSEFDLYLDQVTRVRADVRTIVLGLETIESPTAFARRFHAIPARIGDGRGLDGLAAAQETIQPFLREDSDRHVVVFTNDDLPMLVGDADDIVTTVLGPDVRVHVVGSFEERTAHNPFGACVGGVSARRRSERYAQLATRRGGMQTSICDFDIERLLDALGERTVRREDLPCEFSLPQPPPSGFIWDYEPELFTVSLDGESLPRHDSSDACRDAGGWWYYGGSDRIVFCPATCARSGEATTLEVNVGCPGD